ncbi:hypothetical protein KO527_16570 [Pseudoalteromonas sp. C2R02]|uniref:hypothetical protein n=1 Tax=Pseudoalteromonas sp. C2R02 TaxID=2841565 RepID=UPI001C09B21F|nr:hypothetical protein [Pseudoalteromonas sp. C2R02]MBU2970968.1 hypothetical protein [Pseudoalteromonas sp. C2R02]
MNIKKIILLCFTLLLLIMVWLSLKQDNLIYIQQVNPTNTLTSDSVVSADTIQEIVKDGSAEVTLADKQQDYILECSPKTKEIDLTQYADQSIGEINSKLKNSGSSFDLLAYNLMQDFKVSKTNSQKQAQINFDWLLEYSQSNGFNNLVLFSLLQACAANIKLLGCDEVEIKAKSTLVENAAMWQVIASKYIKQGNEKEAINAIKNAEKSTFYTNYNFEFEDLYRESLLANGFANDYNQSIILAKGYSMARPVTGLNDIYKSCKDNLNTMKTACLDMALVMKAKSTSTLISVVGANLLKEIFKVSNNVDEIQKLDKYIKEIYPENNERQLKISSLMTYDESLTINFIENWRNHGEIIANKMLIQEAIDKSRDPSYNPCI